MASVRPNLDRMVAHMPGVRNEVSAEAQQVATRARALLAAHRHDGDSKIEVRRAGGSDSIVSLVDPAAVSIEYGRGEYTRDGQVIGATRGLYIMTRAAGGDG